MLVIIPPTLYGRIGAILSALIVVFCVVGLTMHRDFYAGKRRTDFFCYYTNVSNALVLLYFSLIAPRLYANPSLHKLVPHAEFCVMISIMLTLCVFHLMIHPKIKAKREEIAMTRAVRIMRADNLFIHYLVPLLVFAYWFLCTPRKHMLHGYDVIIGTVVPIVYLLVLMLSRNHRSVIKETGSRYPYSFLDAEKLGSMRVWINCAGIYAALLLAGAGCIGFLQLAYAAFGTGHALILI